MFHFRIITTPDGNQIIDRNLSTPYESLTPMQMAEKLLEFNRDFSDSAEDIQNEKEHVVELFEKLQNSNEFNILAHYLDLMFMNDVFK